MMPSLLAVCIVALLLFGYQALNNWSNAQRRDNSARRPFLFDDDDDSDDEIDV